MYLVHLLPYKDLMIFQSTASCGTSVKDMLWADFKQRAAGSRSCECWYSEKDLGGRKRISGCKLPCYLALLQATNYRMREAVAAPLLKGKISWGVSFGRNILQVWGKKSSRGHDPCKTVRLLSTICISRPCTLQPKPTFVCIAWQCLARE